MGSLSAEPDISFQVAGKNYQLTGGHAVITTKQGKMQLVIAAKDSTAKAMFAITAELPAGSLDNVLDVSAEFHPVSLIVMNTKGVYSLAPHVTLARDHFMRYHKKEEVETDELEDDPNDRPHERSPECRAANGHGHHFSEKCLRQMQEKRHKRKKIRVKFVKHGPTWVNKTREQRVETGDGIMREEKYRDTSFILRLTPVKVNGKLTQLTGSFAGVVVYNEGSNPAVKIPLQQGRFAVQVQNVP